MTSEEANTLRAEAYVRLERLALGSATSDYLQLVVRRSLAHIRERLESDPEYLLRVATDLGLLPSPK